MEPHRPTTRTTRCARSPRPMPAREEPPPTCLHAGSSSARRSAVSRLVTSRAARVGRVVGAEELARTVLGVGRAGIPIGHVDDRAMLDHHCRLTRERHRGRVENEAVGHDGAHDRSVGASRAHRSGPRLSRRPPRAIIRHGGRPPSPVVPNSAAMEAPADRGGGAPRLVALARGHPATPAWGGRGWSWMVGGVSGVNGSRVSVRSGRTSSPRSGDRAAQEAHDGD
jgi:hypothetical protein